MTTAGRGGWVVLLAVALCACRPALVWHGHDPHRQHRVEVVESWGGQELRLDGKPGERFHGIAIEAIVFSEDGQRLAYAGQSDEGWHVVSGGKRGPAHDGIGAMVLSPSGDRLAYAAIDGKVWRVFLDGSQGPPLEAVLDGTLRFSKDGAHLVYVAHRTRGVTVVFDQQPGPAFDGIRQLHLAPDSGEPVYVARRGRRSFVVQGSSEGPAYDGIGELTVAPGRVAYAALREPHWHAVVDGRLGRPYDRVDALSFAPGGKRLAYLAQAGGKHVVVVDDVPSVPHAEVIRSTLTFSPTGRLFYAARLGGPAAAQEQDRQPGRHPGPAGKERKERKEGVRMVVDGQPTDPYDELSRPVFSAAADRWGFVAQRAGRTVVVIDGRPSVPYTMASDLTFTADGSGHAYLARRGPHDGVVWNGQRSAVPAPVQGTLVLHPSGEHWACLAAIRGTGGLHLVVDGLPGKRFDMDELTAELARTRAAPLHWRSTATAWIRRWVAVELARALGRD
ncbi:MAG: hypothetical protein JRI68_02090 [Deltaproteobacteria bacterium]|nr:hypothetical protein [Deltaproteobacteria bacterium]